MRTTGVELRLPAVGVALACALSCVSSPAFAVETGTPPQLPPPPPPPMGSSPSPGGAAPKSQSAPGNVGNGNQGNGNQGSPTGPTRVMTGSSSTSSSPSSSSSSSGVSTTSGDSSGGALDTRWALAGMLGVSTDCLGPGLGLRGGKTFDNHIYVGGSFIVHFPGCGLGGIGANTGSLLYFGPEGGYDFDLKAVVLRVYLGLGGAFGYNNSEVVVWPGASVIWSIPDSAFFVGGDIRFLSVWNGPAVGFFATGGVHFGS